MADKTAIEWTDATWNPIRGCSRVSEACRHCYAEGVAARFSKPGLPYEGLARRVALPNGGNEARWTNEIAYAGDTTLLKPLRWEKPRRIFVNSMSDLFHENVPDEIIDRVFAVMAFCPQHTFQILTKRPERMRAYCNSESQAFFDRQFEAMDWVRNHSPFASVREAHEHHGIAWHQPAFAEDMRPLPNVWLGTSVENQATANDRVVTLLSTRAAVRFLSCEPLLGPIDLTSIMLDGKRIDALIGAIAWLNGDDWEHIGACSKVQWVIAGGESGHQARAMHPDWARRLRDDCEYAGVPFFFKQWGEWAHRPDLAHFKPMLTCEWQRLSSHIEGVRPALMVKEGKKAAGRLLDGRAHDDFPEVTNE